MQRAAILPLFKKDTQDVLDSTEKEQQAKHKLLDKFSKKFSTITAIITERKFHTSFGADSKLTTIINNYQYSLEQQELSLKQQLHHYLKQKKHYLDEFIDDTIDELDDELIKFTGSIEKIKDKLSLIQEKLLKIITTSDKTASFETLPSEITSEILEHVIYQKKLHDNLNLASIKGKNDTDPINITQYFYQIMLHMHSHEEQKALTLLEDLKQGVDNKKYTQAILKDLLNIETEDGETLLHKALHEDLNAVAKFLITNSEKPILTKQNTKHATALHLSLLRNNTEIANEIINHAAIFGPDNVITLLTQNRTSTVDGEFNALFIAITQQNKTFIDNLWKIIYTHNYSKNIVNTMLTKSTVNYTTLLSHATTTYYNLLASQHLTHSKSNEASLAQDILLSLRELSFYEPQVTSRSHMTPLTFKQELATTALTTLVASPLTLSRSLADDMSMSDSQMSALTMRSAETISFSSTDLDTIKKEGTSLPVRKI